MSHQNPGYVNVFEYDYTVGVLRRAFRELGLIEGSGMCRLTTLASCEDPSTQITFQDHSGRVFPLPQTIQPAHEFDLLEWKVKLDSFGRLLDPEQVYPHGLYSFSVSYRDERNRDPERHADISFPLPEWEAYGDMEELITQEKFILRSFGYKDSDFLRITYDEACARYGVETLENEHEMRLYQETGKSCIFLTDFPVHTDPYFTMELNTDRTHAKKVDILMSGIETFGSASRSRNPTAMRERFFLTKNGETAEKMFADFGRERVMNEVDGLLDLVRRNPVARCGGGIGLTRLIRSLKLEGLMPEMTK